MHRDTNLRPTLALLAALATGAAPLQARQAGAPPEIALEKPGAVSAEPFSLIRGALELRDGRLLVTDWIEQRIALVDFARGSVADRGRVGAGPAEFRLPGALFAFRGDSALLVDVGNARLAVLAPDGSIARSFKPSDPAAGSPGGADASGRIYYVVPAWRAARELGGDSVELRVLEPESGTSRSVARLHGSTPAPGSALEPRVPFVIFAPQDGFTVTPAGRVLVVRGGDYSIQSFPTGAPVSGAPIPVRPLRASGTDRTAFVLQFVLSSPMSGRGEDGGLGHTPAEFTSDAAVERMVRASSFAATLPPFRAGDIHLDGRGRLWVGRHEHASDPRRYDVFDAAGRPIARVRLAPARRLIAVGTAHAYVVHTDGDGLQRIERHALAALPPSR